MKVRQRIRNELRMVGEKARAGAGIELPIEPDGECMVEARSINGSCHAAQHVLALEEQFACDLGRQ
jgi:hypothetical protein